MASSKPILIVGAGLAGCLMALELARLGYRVVVYEKRPVKDDHPIQLQRHSINLALAPSTLRLLRESAKLKQELSAIATPLHGRVLHPVEGKPIFQPYAAQSSEATLLNPSAGAGSVSRAELIRLLLATASANANIEFRFGESVVACDPERAVLRVENSRHRNISTEGEIIIAADGARSTIRQLLTRRRAAGIRENRTRLKHGYKELSFLSSRLLRKRALHIWPRAGFLLMALPNCDNTFRGALFLPAKGPNGFSRLRNAADVRHFFEKHFPDSLSCIKDLGGQYEENPVSALVSVQCDPWHFGRTVLIGDACHTLYPFSGHGANLALEDCIQLRQYIEQFAPDWPRAFAAFSESRKPKVDYLCEATRAISALVLEALPQEGILGHV
jgi:kynurenine 3-monooxygenase